MILGLKIKNPTIFLRFSVCGSIFWTFCEIPTKFGDVAAQIVAKIAKFWRCYLKFCEQMPKFVTKFSWNIEVWAVQKHVNQFVDLVKSFPTNIYLQKSASIQPRTSHLIFIILAASMDLIFTERSSPLYSSGRDQSASLQVQRDIFKQSACNTTKLSSTAFIANESTYSLRRRKCQGKWCS